MEPTSTLTAPATGDDITLSVDGPQGGENDSLSDDANWTGSENSTPPGGTAPASEPLPGSNAAASLEFGRNLLELRTEKGLSQSKLAGMAECEVASIREYEAGNYRPARPTVKLLAQALDVMPISLGASFTRGDEGPESFELLMRRKPSQALRLQHLVVLLSNKSVSAFAQLVSMTVEEVYAIACSETKLPHGQLDPFLKALPQVRPLWLERGEGEPLQPKSVAGSVGVVADQNGAGGEALGNALGSSSAVAVPGGAGGQNGMGAEALGNAGAAGQVGGSPMPPPPANWTPAITHAQPAPVRAVQALLLPTLDAGAPTYVQLGLGLVAEVDGVLLGGQGAVSGVRLLAGAGGVPALTTPEQLERLFGAMHQILNQRGGE